MTYSPSAKLLLLHRQIQIPVSLSIPPLISLFTAQVSGHCPGHTQLIGITEELTIALIQITGTTHPEDTPSLILRSFTSLPLSSPPAAILPVDPMTWGDPHKKGQEPVDHDILLSVSKDGELAFWRPTVVPKEQVTWKCTGVVKTGRTTFSLAQCSSAKKTVLGTAHHWKLWLHAYRFRIVVPRTSGQELTIWDSKESEFASGLEYRQILDALDPINDLDWTATPDNQSILAVGFSHRVEVLCQQRMTYFDDSPGWGTCWRIDLSR